MILRAEELNREVVEKRFGGVGELEIVKLNDEKQLQGKGRLFAHNTLRPGASLGLHTHNGDVETYYILKGEGIINDNGNRQPVKAGDVIFTDNGEQHSLENTGPGNLEFIALVIYA